jgi:hypothetical protein
VSSVGVAILKRSDSQTMRKTPALSIGRWHRAL